MASLPDLSPEVLVTEPWLFAEKTDAEGLEKRQYWQKQKVMNDIRQHTALAFSPAQQDQWAALENFHDWYPTSNQVPTLPFSVTGEGERTWEFTNGTPIDWRAAFVELTLLHDRYALPLFVCV